MNKNFLIFSIGPVQSFIATARRTQDLYAGSRLLSHLMIAALKAACDNGGEPLYPVRGEDDIWPMSVPNRVVLLVDLDNIKKVGVRMSEAAITAWENAAIKVASKIRSYAPETGWEHIWERQIQHWLETYWVASPWDGKPETYGLSYQTASDRLEQRKRLRHYPIHEEPGEKCSLCGVREALHGERGDRSAVISFWQNLRQKTPKSTVRQGERLCAVCTIKRFLKDANVLDISRFSSTSSLASADFRFEVLKYWEELGPAVGELTAAWNKIDPGLIMETDEPNSLLRIKAEQLGDPARRFLRYDGDFLYPDFYTRRNFLEVLGRNDDAPFTSEEWENIQDAKKKLATLQKECRNLNIQMPSPYFSILLMDGDRMGNQIYHLDNNDKHQYLSKKLSKFAGETVPKVIEEETTGLVVYAGGDDVMAFLSKTAVLEAAEKLRKKFGEDVTFPGQEKLTVSAGVVISHQQSPLQAAVEAARNTEKCAKSPTEYGRNAIALTALRRSGEPRQTGCKWEAGQLSTVDLIQTLIKWFETGILSPRFAYEFASEAPALAKVPRNGVIEEIARLMKRHQSNSDEIGETQRQEIADRIAKIAEILPDRSEQSGLEQMADWAIVARFIAQGGTE